MKTLAQLRAQKTQLLARLDNPNLTDTEMTTLADEAQTVSFGISAHEKRERLLTGDGGTTAEDRQRGNLGDSRTNTGPASLMACTRAFTESDQLAAFRANGYTGRVGLELPALDTRATIDTGNSSGGAFQNPQRPSEVFLPQPDRAPRIVDLLDVRPTDLNAVEWVQQTSTANAAAEVAEGTVKPEAGFTFTVVTDPVRTVAHWVPITRQALDDSPTLAQHVEGRLMYGLDNRVDSQALNGTGTAPQLRGILNTPGIGVYVAPADEAALISVRRAITVALVGEVTPDGLVLHPTDWERIELSTDTQGMFRVSPNVTGALAPRIWGLSVVPTTAITAQTFLVGAFRLGATLWRRSSALFVTDSHAGNFTSNVLVILAEMRLALSVTMPRAFVKGTFVGTA